MPHQRHHPLIGIRQAAAGLQAEPLVDYQCVLLPLIVERIERDLTFRAVDVGQTGQGRQRVGHVVGIIILVQATFDRGLVANRRQVGEAGVLQAAFAGVVGIETVLARGIAGGIHVYEIIAQGPGQCAPHKIARLVDGIRVGDLAQLQQVGFARQRQRLGNQRPIKHGVDQRLAHGLDKQWVKL